MQNMVGIVPNADKKYVNVYRWARCRSVRPSLCQTCGLWQNGRNVCPHSYTT